MLDFVQAIKIRIKHSPKSSRMSIGQSEAKQKQKQQSIKRTEFTSGDFILYLSLYGFFSFLNPMRMNTRKNTKSTHENILAQSFTINESEASVCVGACVFLSSFLFAHLKPHCYVQCTYIGKNHHAFLVYYIRSRIKRIKRIFRV